MYFLPAPRVKKPEGFFARLVSPEEAQKPEVKQPGEPPAPLPARPPVPKKESRVPVRPRIADPVPPVPVVPMKPREIPSDEKPLVPGEGRDSGKPPPEGLRPGTGKEDKSEQDPLTRHAPAPGYERTERLFDPFVIGDIAKKDMPKETKKENAITFNTTEYRYAGYMRKLKEKIEHIWVYPPEARARGLYGDLKIRFVIRKNGSLESVELVRTSGYKMLDDAAIKALKDGEPYWPLPDEWGMDTYPVLGHFIYSIYGYQIR